MSSVDRQNSFGFKFLSSIDGIEKKTIDVLLDNGFHSVRSLVTVKFETDLYPIPDILLAQKSILREAINELQSEYRQMNIKPNSDKTVTRRLLEEFLIDDNSNIDTKVATNEASAMNWDTTASQMSLTPESPEVDQKPKQKSGQKSPKKVVKTLPYSQTSFVAKLGLRSANKRSLLKNKATNGEQNDSTSVLEPEVVLIEGKSKCGVCGDLAKYMGGTAPYCEPCRTFYRKIKSSNKQIVCGYDGDCRITTKTRTDCRGCRWSRCRQVIERLVDSSDVPISQQSATGSTVDENPSDTPNEEDNIEVYIANTGYVADIQPTINLTPLSTPTPKSQKRGPKVKKVLTHYCRVCGQKMAKHQTNHGVVSCDGCGIFFSRVVKNELIVRECVNSNNKCIINALNRNQCRFCRYNACLRAGMVLTKSSVARTDVRQTQEEETEVDDIPSEEHMEEEEEEESEQVMPDLTGDVSDSTGYDFTSISCGRNPVENPIGKRVKRRKNWS